jgi:hypothetical protein
MGGDPVCYLGRVAQDMSERNRESQWLRVRAFEETGEGSGAYVESSRTVTQSAALLYPLEGEDRMAFDDDIGAWRSEHGPPALLLPGVTPRGLHSSFLVDETAARTDFEAHCSLHFDDPLDALCKEHGTLLHALPRFLSRPAQIKFLYAETTPDGCEGGSAADVVIVFKAVVTSGLSGDTDGDGRNDGTGKRVREPSIAEVIERTRSSMLDRGALADALRRRCGLSLRGASPMTVLRMSPSGKFQSVSERPGASPLRDGDFVAFANPSYAPIHASERRPKWFVGRVVRQVKGPSGTLVSLQWFKEVRMGSGLFVPTNDWFIEDAGRMRHLDMAFDPETTLWRAPTITVEEAAARRAKEGKNPKPPRGGRPGGAKPG